MWVGAWTALRLLWHLSEHQLSKLEIPVALKTSGKFSRQLGSSTQLSMPAAGTTAPEQDRRTNISLSLLTSRIQT